MKKGDTMQTVRRLCGIILLLSVSMGLSGTAYALCSVSTSPQTFGNNSTMNAESCDTAGNQRETLGTLLSGENQGTSQATSFIATSGAVVQFVQILGTGGVPSTATDATTTPIAINTGRKTFTGRITCTGTCVQTQKIYGTWRNTADNTVDNLICTITLNATTSDQASCANINLNFSYYYVTTTATSGTTPLAGVFVQY